MRDMVDDFGFVGDSSTSNNTAFQELQAAIDAGLAGRLYFPFNRSTSGQAVATGSYKTTLSNPLVIKNDYTELVFENGARINWQPPGAGTCVKWENPNGPLLRCGWENVEIRAPNNVGAEMIGMALHDVRYSTFRGFRASGFAGSTSTGLKVMGRDRLLFMDLDIQAERPLWLSLNDREPGPNDKDIDHCLFCCGNLIAVTRPRPCIYIDPGYVLRDVGFIGGWALVGGYVQWIDGSTVPRQPSDNFYIHGARPEQLADQGPVGADLFMVDIQKHAAAPLADLELAHVMLAPSQGNDWSGVRVGNVSRTSLRHTVFRGRNGTAIVGDGNGTLEIIQSELYHNPLYPQSMRYPVD